MVCHVAVPLNIIFTPGTLSYDDTLRTVSDQKRQPLPAPGVPLFIMSRKGQHNYQFNITILRLLLQPEYDFSGPLIYAKAPTYQKAADSFLIEHDKLIVHPFLQTLAAIVVLVVLPFEPSRPMAGDGTGMQFHMIINLLL